MQHFNKYGIAALMFFMGTTLPAVAQDEAQDEVATEVPAEKAKKTKKAKSYPTEEVKGKVVDAATGEPLAGAQIQAFNNKYYTAMADENGEFTIKLPKFVTAITVHLDGYNVNNVALGGRTSGVNVALLSNLFKGEYKMSDTANQTVGVGEFDNNTAITADQGFQNTLGAEIRTIQRSANPGQGVAMFINGINSLNSNAQPLIILDGVIFDQMYDSQMLHTGYFNNLLQGINPDDIESVEVLKNGTAIYGAKAANGVIVIKTKRCRSMATRIDVNISGGVELTPKTYDLMDASEYRALASQMLKTTDTKLTEFKFLNNDPNYYYYNMYHNNTDWNDEVSREAWTQNYGIAIQGGDDIAKYNLSVGFTDSKSTLDCNDMQRFNVRFNTDISLNKWFSTRFDASYTNVVRNLRSDGWADGQNMQALASPGALANIKAPFLSPYDFSTDGKVSSYIADADDYLYEVLGAKGSIANPKAINYYGDAKNKNRTDCTMINVAISPTWEPTKNFSLTEQFAYTMQSFDEHYFTPVVGMPEYKLDEIPTTTMNSKYTYFSKHNSVYSDTRAKWDVLYNGPHKLDVFGGVRFMNDTYSANYMIADNTGNDKTPNVGSASPRLSGSDTNWRSLSYYANVDYNYKEKYYLTGQLSMETSSRFGKKVDAGLKMFGVAWGLFPSIQGTWVLSNEKWFKPTRGVNMLKLTAGFESVGNDAIDNTATLTYLSAGLMLGNSTSYMGLGQIGNPSLRWETTNRFNVGIEGNFLNNRLNVRANYFNSKTTNLVSLGTLAYVAGLTDYYTNDGELENQGFDAAFTAKVINEKNFKFELGASVGHYKNKLTKLPQGKQSFETDMYGGTILTEVGRPVGVFYGYKTDGVYASSEAAEADGKYIIGKSSEKVYFKAGDMKFVDRNGDNVIDENDRFVIGDPNPDIFGNINLKFHFGQNWTLGADFKYSLGNDVYNYERSVLESGSMFINQTTAMNRHWIAEGQVTDIPQVTYQDPMGNSRFSDRWIEDGSYLKLKNVTLSYRLPIQNEYLQGITVWAAANNLFTLTKYLGPDPEVSCGNGVLYQGIDAGYRAFGRSFHLGVKINL